MPMVKVIVLKNFYCKEGKILYLDEERYKELSALGYVELVKEEKHRKAIVSNQKIEHKCQEQ